MTAEPQRPFPSGLRGIARKILPSWLRRLFRRLFGWRWFRGYYLTWTEAAAHAQSYSSPGILEKVLVATLAVQTGRAAYERDAVLFAEPCPEGELLAALLRVASAHDGQLNLLDFGGSLGTSYWQHRAFLPALKSLRWDVVEQEHFVEAGRTHVEQPAEPLRFFLTIEEAEQSHRHNVLLASGVIHCLPEPYVFLEKLIASGPEYLIFHNLPLHDDRPDHLRVEHVPPEIYEATYPVWFFNRQKFLGQLTAGYDVVHTYASSAVWPIGWSEYPSTGLLLRRKGTK